MWTILISSRAQGVDSVLAVERPLMGGACRRNPQHFGVCTQVRGFSAQVIHSLCTRKASKQVSRRARRQQRSGCRCWHDTQHAERQDLAWVWRRSSEKAGAGRSPPQSRGGRSTNARPCPGRPRSTARRGQHPPADRPGWPDQRVPGRSLTSSARPQATGQIQVLKRHTLSRPSAHRRCGQPSPAPRSALRHRHPCLHRTGQPIARGRGEAAPNPE